MAEENILIGPTGIANESVVSSQNESVLPEGNNLNESNSSDLSQQSFSNIPPNAYQVVQFEYITGWRKNSRILVIDDYFYLFNCTSKLGASWLCSNTVGKNRVCRARVYIVGDICIKLNKSPEHCHEPNTEERKQLCVLNEVKRRCSQMKSFLSTTRLTVRDIFNQVLLE